MNRVDPFVVPDLARRRDRYSPPLDVVAMVAVEAGPGLALCLGRWFFPPFVERDGCVLNADRFDDDSFLAFWEATGGDARAIERVINHVHLRDEFPNDPVGPEAFAELADLMAAGWQASLGRAFPQRGFAITVDGPSEELEVTVCQVV